MYDHLTARSREVVRRLVDGEAVTIGDETVGPVGAEQKKALSLLAAKLAELEQKSGADLAQAVLEALPDYSFPEEEEPAAGAPSESPAVPWRLGRVRACSFRGLAPAEQVWEHDFQGRSHLLYGPNGCGKSSLLGAVAWCLTGLVFRDDVAPANAEEIAVYTDGTDPKAAGPRPDALSLTDGTGHSTDPNDEYWVELELIADGSDGGSRGFWLRRHSSDGLSTSQDGAAWEPLKRLDEAGIAELDAELMVAMPARVAHIRFGKDRDLLALFSQLIGLDDLERVAYLAGRTRKAMNRKKNKLTDKRIPDQQELVNDAACAIDRAGTDGIRKLSTFSQALGDDRTLEGIKAFGKEVAETLAAGYGQLATDLKVEIPATDVPEYREFEEQLSFLPGQVNSAVSALSKSLCEVMPKSIGLPVPSAEKVDELARQLEAFEAQARTKAHQRLDWARKEREDANSPLMLAAAARFREDAMRCPVCTQDLKPVPKVQKRLEELRPLSREPHLRQGIEDLERALLADLDELVAPSSREKGKETLSERLLADWSALKGARFPGLLAGVAQRFDDSVQKLSEQVDVDPPVKRPRLAEGYEQEFPEAFAKLDVTIGEAWGYVQLLRSALQHRDAMLRELTRLLKPVSDGGMGESLSAVLERGSATNREIGALSAVQDRARNLWKGQKLLNDLQAKEAALTAAADALEPAKGLAQLVQQEVAGVVASVEPKMKDLYTKLYPDELLDLDMLTPGHPANPSKREAINAYFRAGDERVPVAPFSNSGRFRALVLSFVFALLEHSSNTLGLLLLDDPALSMDDDHKAGFADHLVGPKLNSGQVLLATHYENFYKAAEPVFAGSECLHLHPRRRATDAVGFEPGKLLQRVEDSLSENKGTWRETAIDLRRWVERTLATLSSYCPEPFFVFNDIPGSIRNYEQITDNRVATAKRREILGALTGPQFGRVMHRIAHDEEPTRPEAVEAHKRLTQCQKYVRQEIERFKALHRHTVIGRSIGARPSIAPLSLDAVLAEAKVPIVAQVAAAKNGIPIDVDENSIALIAQNPVARMRLDTLAPIAWPGQFLILDTDESEPADSDVVVAETESGKRYARRFWRRGRAIHLEAINPTHPCAPVVLTSGTCLMRRIVGVLFERSSASGPPSADEEWAAASGGHLGLLKDVVGMRVAGASLEPVARDGQIALIRRREYRSSVGPHTLACVDIDGAGAVIKRCYPASTEWTLCSVNVNELEEPMKVKPSRILHVYPLVGVLFELGAEEAC